MIVNRAKREAAVMDLMQPVLKGTEGLPQQVVPDTGGAAAERGTEGEVLENKENNPGQGGPPQPITPPKSKYALQ